MKKFEIYLMIIVFLLVTTPLVSAFFQFDNIKRDLIIDKDTSEYGKIEIRNSVFGWEWFQLDKIMSLELKENTEICLDTGCLASTEIIMYEDGKLIDDIRFIDLETKKETSIESYDIYVNGDLYNGEEVTGYSSGVIYDVELKGKVYAFQTVDWQIKSAGTDWITEWATWNSSIENGTVAYWKFDETSGYNVRDTMGNYDLTSTSSNWTTGLLGNALSFTGTNNVNYTWNESMFKTNQTDFTISLWVKFANWFNVTSSAHHGILGLPDSDTANVLDIKFDSNKGKLHMKLEGQNQGLVQLYGTTTQWDANTWYHIVARWSSSTNNVSMHINGLTENSTTHTGSYQVSSPAQNFTIGKTKGVASINGSIDEAGVWNRSLSDSEIVALYNSGAGISPSEIITTLNAPINDYNTTNQTVMFNCTTTTISPGLSVTNVSLYHNASGPFVLNQTNSTSRNHNSTAIFSVMFDYGSYTWNCYACANNSACAWGINRTFNVREFFINSQTYNSTTWETDTEDFIVNVSGSGLALTANLWYNGTSYAGTKTGTDYDALFTKTLDIPTGLANRSFYWEISSSGTPYINYTEQNQTIKSTLLDLCNATLTVPYINFTFQDEGNLTATNGSIDITSWDYYLGSGNYNKTLTFVNTTVNPSYGFCLNPDVAHKTLHHSTVVQYYGTGYPQRRWTYNTDLTNVTLDQTLYLLGNADGIYSIYQVQESTGSAIVGVTVQVERQFSGTWTLVEQGTTDGAGSVTFWLNPDYDHRLTFIKLGYTSVQETLRPSSSTYTVVMTTSGAENATYNSSIEGIRWTIRPNPGMLNPNTNYTFEFNVTSLINSLDACKMELLDENSTVLSTTTNCGATGGNLSVSFNTSTHPNLRGRFSLDIGEGYFVVDSDAFWGILFMDFPERGTIKEFFSHLRDLDEFGDDEGRAEFSRIIMFFLILVIVLGIMSSTTGWDFSTQGGAILLLFPIILMASIAGFFTVSYMPWAGDALFEAWMQKYTVALISFFISGGYLCHKIADSMK